MSIFKKTPTIFLALAVTPILAMAASFQLVSSSSGAVQLSAHHVENQTGSVDFTPYRPSCGDSNSVLTDKRTQLFCLRVLEQVNKDA